MLVFQFKRILIRLFCLEHQHGRAMAFVESVPGALMSANALYVKLISRIYFSICNFVFPCLTNECCNVYTLLLLYHLYTL
jgi:hypothetical protein